MPARFPSAPLVTVFGGTGFLGRRIVASLLGRDARVRIAARHPHRPGMPSSDRVQHVVANVTDLVSIEAAIDGADAVANAVSLYVEKGAATFRAIHLEAALAVAEAAARHGARLVHVSGIGADSAATSPYVRFRGLGSVEIHLEFRTVAAAWIIAAKLASVLQARMAMRLNSLSLPKKFSMRWRHL